ncbi:serine/threonine protein kinase, partial [Nonomuraea mesophila]
MARGASDLPAGVRPLTVGDPVIIGRCPLLGRLGAGGMGVVYLAEHPQRGLVALKTPHTIHLNDATLRARFAEEVAFSRRLVPFCTAAVVEDGTDHDRPYLVTEYIPGPALSQVVFAQGALTPDRAYGVALGVAAALVAVHEAGLVHRDLKPANVLLSARGPRVIDFGIARDVDTLSAHTQAGQVMGSPGWVAPERLTGAAALPASDVFAWGCLVAFAAAGHHPFGSGEADVLTRRILFEPPRVQGVPALLRPAVEAALAKEPADRPRAADLLRVLLAAGGVGDPRDSRRAVGEVLRKVWTPVPYPPGGGRVRHGDTGSGELSGAAVVERSRRRRRARTGASLAHASFAALATVSIAAVTVIAASGADGTPLGGGSLLPGDPPSAVRPEGSAVSTTRPTPAGHVPSTRALLTTGPATEPTTGQATGPATDPATPTVFVTRTRTRKGARSPSPQRWDTGHPRAPWSGSAGPQESGGDDPGACAAPAGRRRGAMARRDCPRPSSSITTIPQDGPGESPDPSTPCLLYTT